ncbi:MAG: tetratricopeptide repeat protein [Betaproteobacteria bacterium]
MTFPHALPPSDLQQLLGLFQARRFDAMAQLARDLLERFPDAGLGWKALGIALLAQGRDAVAALQQAAALLPGDAELRASLVEAHLNRGHALMKASRPQEATDSYQEALRLDARHAHARACLGIALQALGQHDAAVQSLGQAVALRPDLVNAHFCLGSSLLVLGRASDALQSLRRVLELKPDHAPAHADLGSALKALGRLDEALPAYRRAIELQPDLPLNRANLGAACRELGRMQEALACYRHAMALEPARLGAFSDALFVQNYLADDAPPAQARQADARRFGALAAAQARPFTQWPPHGGDRLRVGLVSADLREHPVGYFAEALMAQLSTTFADRIDLFVYANSDVEDALTTRLRTLCRRWTSIARLDDAAAAGLIHADGVDILVDLSGHTAGNRLPLFAWKPAPVQASWLGYCATTGLEAMDHFIADPWIAPPAADADFTEKIWRLPDTFLCFTPPDLDIAVGPPPALSRGHVTFGCFNKFNKLNDDVVALWALVLQAVPGSQLLLKSAPFEMASIRQHLSHRFALHDIAPDRLILEGASPRGDYLRAYDRVDIALDPFPYPGGTTSVEGLWMGVPVLTLPGSCALARQGTSILRNVGLPDWIAVDAQDYVERAARHARDVEALASLRLGLRQRLLDSPLCDGERFARHFAQAMRAMCARA